MKVIALIAAASTAITCGGCYSSVNTAENTDTVYQRNFVRNRRIVTDKGLANRIKILRIDEAQLETGLLKIQVQIANTRRSDFKYAYRFTWFDENGMEVATSASSWIEKDIYGGDQQFINAVAPNIRCKDFMIRFREL